MAAEARQRVAIVGVGKIGSAFAFHLAHVGHHDVTVVARPGSTRLQQLQHDRAIVSRAGERAEVSVANALDESVAYDVVIVTLLAYQVEALIPSLQRSKSRCLVFMFNNFRPERLRDAIGPARCAFGMPLVQATLDAEGRVDAKVGAGGQRTKLSTQACVDLFTGAELPAVLEPDMLQWLRCHAPLCIAFESGAAAAVRRGGGASWAECVTLARGLHACFSLIEGQGFAIYPAGKRRLQRSPRWAVATMLWGLTRVPPFRDLLASGVDEARHLVDSIVASAGQGGGQVDVASIVAMKL